MKLILIERSQLGQKELIYAMHVTQTQNVSITSVNVKMVSLVQDICVLQCSASVMELISSSVTKMPNALINSEQMILNALAYQDSGVMDSRVKVMNWRRRTIHVITVAMKM